MHDQVFYFFINLVFNLDKIMFFIHWYIDCKRFFLLQESLDSGLQHSYKFCHVCSQPFQYHWQYLQHFKNHHKGSTNPNEYEIPKAFVCNICGYSTHFKGSLVLHERVHSGERPYQCSYCPYTATSSSNLLRHKRLKHNYA